MNVNTPSFDVDNEGQKSQTPITEKDTTSYEKSMVSEDALEGEPGGGNIEYIQQIHKGPEKIMSKLTPEGKQEINDLVGKSQLEIYRYLEKEGAKYIFAEGICEETIFKEHQNKFPQDMLDKFSNSNWEDLSPEYKKCFYEFIPIFGNDIIENHKLSPITGGAILYYLTHPGVKILPTTNVATENKAQEILKNSEVFEEALNENNDFFLTHREDVASNYIEDFVKKHPNEKVFVVYGGAHKFEDNFQEFDKQPKMTRTRLSDSGQICNKIQETLDRAEEQTQVAELLDKYDT